MEIMNGAPVVDINSSQSSLPGMPQPPRMPVPTPMPTPALNQTLAIFDRQPLPPGVSTVYICGKQLRDVGMERLSRLFYKSSQLFFYQLHLQNCPCLCFPEPFELVANSSSAVEISWQMALSDIFLRSISLFREK